MSSTIETAATPAVGRTAYWAGWVLSGLLIAALAVFPDTYRSVYTAAAILVTVALFGYAVASYPPRANATGADAQ